MADTVDRIVAASRLPLSIVIVGVGGAEFKNMVSVRHIHEAFCVLHTIITHKMDVVVFYSYY